MAAVKSTFTLDELTVARIERAARQKGRSKSEIVREAIHEYAQKPELMSAEERDRMLTVLREIMASPPTGSAASAAAEQRELRAARRLPGRLHPVD